MLSDLRLTLRHLTRARAFTITAILTLAVGIGAATAMFSALRAMVIHPFNYPAAERLVHVWSGDGWSLSPADFFDLHDQSSSFEAFGVYSSQSVNLGAEKAEAISAVTATHGVLRAYGVPAAMGRLLEPADDVKGAPPVAVISHHLWRQNLGGDPDVVGRDFRLNGAQVRIVGVMPEGFEFASPRMGRRDCQIWLPYALEDQKQQRDSHWLGGVARLREGVTVGQADAEIKSIGRRLSELYPDSNTHKHFLVRSLHYEMTKELGSQVWLLFGAVSLLLLVACANVASMLLARGAQRQGEFGVRVALGATRANLLRLALTESMVLAVGGALIGLGLAAGGVEILRTIAPINEARKAAITLDGTVLLFALGATCLASLLAGVPPALAALRTSIASVIRSDARGAVGSRSRHHMLRALIIGQIAVAFVLANGAALFSASYFKLLAANQSLSSDRVLSAQLSLRGERYEENEDRVRFWEQLLARLQSMPGVTSVGLTSKMPLRGGSNTNALVNDEVYDPTQRRLIVERSSITPDYFKTMGLTLVQGRNLEPTDDMTDDKHLGLVVNQAMVRKAWPDKNPIGQIMRANQPSDPWYIGTVVGVVEDVRQWGADAEVQPEMYTTPKGHWGNTVYLNIRSALPAAQLAPLVRADVAQIDSDLALQNVRTLEQLVLDSTESQRVLAGLVNTFTAITLGLVAVGLYGTLSYHFLQRTREIGVRVALGAAQRDILRLVFGQGSRWIGCGVVLGTAGSIALATTLKALLYNMGGIDPLVLLGASLAIALAGGLACWLPARRAARLNPLTALHAN